MPPNAPAVSRERPPHRGGGAPRTAVATPPAAAAVRGPGAPGPRLVLASALATAAVAEALDASAWPRIAACALAGAGVLWLVLTRLGPADRLSWLDAAMGASSTAGLAVAVGA